MTTSSDVDREEYFERIGLPVEPPTPDRLIARPDATDDDGGTPDETTVEWRCSDHRGREGSFRGLGGLGECENELEWTRRWLGRRSNPDSLVE